MDNNGNIDLLTAFKKLLAENNSQQARLVEYDEILESRNNEIVMLQTMLAEANEYRSNTDSDLRELNELRHSISNVQQEVIGSGYMSPGTQKRLMQPVSIDEQLTSLTAEYTQLQSQFKDLQTQLVEANNRNLVLQQQTGRIAELESLLRNAEEEIDYWKAKADRRP